MCNGFLKKFYRQESSSNVVYCVAGRHWVQLEAYTFYLSSVSMPLNLYYGSKVFQNQALYMSEGRKGVAKSTLKMEGPTYRYPL